MENHIELALLANTIFAMSLIAAVAWPMVARGFLAVAFLGTSLFNFYMLADPGALAASQEMSLLPLFKNYVIGFSNHLINSVVLIIAVIQFVVGIGLLLRGRFTIVAMMIGVAYGLFITSLGGYEFPAALVMSIAFLILAGSYKHDLLWRWNQYRGNNSTFRSQKRIAG